MSHVIILARNAAEGNEFVRQNRASLPTGRHIIANTANQVLGVIPHLVIELAGFSRRPDRHAILAAVKRSSKKYLVCEWLILDERGMMSERDLEVAYRYEALRQLPDPDADMVRDRLELMELMSDEQAPEPIRRRTNCKECKTLHFVGEAHDPSYDVFANL